MCGDRAPKRAVTGLGPVQSGLTLRPQNSHPGFFHLCCASQQLVPREWTEGSGHHAEAVRLHYVGSREPLKTSDGGQSTLIKAALEQDEQAEVQRMSWKANETPPRAAGIPVGRPCSGTRVPRPYFLVGPNYTPVCAWKLSMADMAPEHRGLWKGLISLLVWRPKLKGASGEKLASFLPLTSSCSHQQHRGPDALLRGNRKTS